MDTRTRTIRTTMFRKSFRRVSLLCGTKYIAKVGACPELAGILPPLQLSIGTAPRIWHPMTCAASHSAFFRVLVRTFRWCWAHPAGSGRQLCCADAREHGRAHHCTFRSPEKLVAFLRHYGDHWWECGRGCDLWAGLQERRTRAGEEASQEKGRENLQVIQKVRFLEPVCAGAAAATGTLLAVPDSGGRAEISKTVFPCCRGTGARHPLQPAGVA